MGSMHCGHVEISNVARKTNILLIQYRLRERERRENHDDADQNHLRIDSNSGHSFVFVFLDLYSGSHLSEGYTFT